MQNLSRRVTNDPQTMPALSSKHKLQIYIGQAMNSPLSTSVSWQRQRSIIAERSSRPLFQHSHSANKLQKTQTQAEHCDQHAHHKTREDVSDISSHHVLRTCTSTAYLSAGRLGIRIMDYLSSLRAKASSHNDCWNWRVDVSSRRWE